MKLGILGCGNMAEAVIAGIRRKKAHVRIIGYDVRPSRLSQLQKKYRLQKALSAVDVARKSDVILLAVKPQDMKDLLDAIRPAIKPAHLVLSIAAGIGTTFIRKHLRGHKRIIRVMPNTPALVGQGVSAYYASPGCLTADKNKALVLLSAVGIAFEIKREGLLDAVTGLSGSGPAFVYLFIDALIQGGVASGLPRALATELAVQTTIGAAHLLSESGTSAGELIKKVASKGGTTEAGLKVLKKGRVSSSVTACVVSASKKARALRKTG